MRKKLFATYMMVMGITILITIFFSWKPLNAFFYGQLEEESHKQTVLLQDLLAFENQTAGYDIKDFANNYGEEIGIRVTIIDADGFVLGDSLQEPEMMENHKYREEVKEACQEGKGVSVRFSDTLQSYYYYYAVPLTGDFDGVLRVATPVSQIQTVIWELVNSFLFSLLIGVLVSILLAYTFAKRIIVPIDHLTNYARSISRGNYDQTLLVSGKDQVKELGKALNTMTKTMKSNLHNIETKKAELESVLTSMDMGLVAIDPNYKVILNNEMFVKMLGVREPLVGKLFFNSIRDVNVIDVVEDSMEKNIFVKKETKLEIEGVQKIFRVSATPIKGKKVIAKELGVLLTIQDITEIRKYETMRSDFVSNVTHELRTPLTSIKGFVEALKDGALHDEKVAARFLEIIDIEVERVSDLIEDILSLSEIETMAKEKDKKYCNIKELVQEVFEILNEKAKEKSLRLELETAANLREYYGNYNRIKQLMLNLLDNSIKYTEKGQVKVCCFNENGNLVIEVADTGIGIKTSDIPRLFERFYRVDQGRSRSMGGTGLGLSIVKHIVALYGGDIRVSSTENVGSTFRITLPESEKQ